jgi:mono/diheme cytochrome c family protein
MTMRTVGGWGVAAVLAALVLSWGGPAAVLVAQEVAEEEAPPADQTYTGSKRCASCHFNQFMTWKKTKHAKAFEDLTAKYQTDQNCLKCHTTGLGEESGYKDAATTPTLAGVTCESCHGPGSKHEEIAQQYAKVKTLSPEQEKEVRGSIWKMLPKNVCVECHVVQGHKDSPTPPEMRKKD